MELNVYTLGCKVNQYETEQIREQLQAVFGNTQAEIYIINSCTVTAESSRKTRQTVNRIRKEHPDAVLVLTGCYPQAFPEEAYALPADIIIGNKSNLQLAQYVGEYLQYREKICRVEARTEKEPYVEQPICDFDGHTRAFIKIQDGCNRFCSYCIIPYARGRARSRRMEDLASELRVLAKKGYREIVFTGIDLTSYGQDLGCDLADAVCLAQQIDGIDRIRLGSLEPDRMQDAMLNRMVACSKFCPQFHLSLQSGSNAVLKRMNRHYTAEEYAALCDKIRNAFPNATVTTDIITGFPGETDADFLQTVQFAQQICFEKVHVFPYSERSGTRAAAFTGRIEKKERERRARVLSSVCAAIRKECLQKTVGTVVNVLFETPKDGLQNGFTENYTPVAVACEEVLTGQIRQVRIMNATDDFCVGELCD